MPAAESTVSAIGPSIGTSGVTAGPSGSGHCDGDSDGSSDGTLVDTTAVLGPCLGQHTSGRVGIPV